MLVEFGRRQALGVVLGRARARPPAATKPIVDRVRADGPLLPPLTLALARWIAEHYLAPPALVIRAMLPPGLLERLELVAERTPAATPATDEATRRRSTPTSWTSWRPGATGPRPGRARGPGGACCAGCGRSRPPAWSARLDAARRGGRAALRALGPTDRRGMSGRRAALSPGDRPGRPLGPRQSRRSRAGGRADGVGGRPRRRARRPPRDGRRRAARPPRPGRDRGPRAAAPAAGRPAPAGARRPPVRRCSAGRRRGASRTASRGDRGRDPRPLLLDGVTGGGKTAIYVEADRGARGGRPALVLVPEIALALPLVDRLRADLDAGRARPLRARRWRAGRRVAPDPRRRRRHRRRDAAGGRRAAGRRRAGHRRRGARPGVQERPDAAAPGPRHGDPSSPAGRAAVVLGSATPAVDSVGRALGRARTTRVVLPRGRSGPRRSSRSSTCAPSSPTGNRGLLSRPLDDGARRARHGGRRPGDPRPQPARDRVGRAVPRLRPRPGLPRLRASARLPPGRHDAALPPLRPGDAARDALPVVRLAADPLPRRRHGAGRARGPRTFPACGSRGSTATWRSGAARRSGSSMRSRPARSTSSSARASSPRASTSRGHARRGRVVRRRAQPARRARGRADLPAAEPGGRPGGPGRPTGPGHPPDLPARPPGDPGGGDRRRGAFYAAELALRRGSGRRRSAGW